MNSHRTRELVGGGDQDPGLHREILLLEIPRDKVPGDLVLLHDECRHPILEGLLEHELHHRRWEGGLPPMLLELSRGDHPFIPTLQPEDDLLRRINSGLGLDGAVAIGEQHQSDSWNCCIETTFSSH